VWADGCAFRLRPDGALTIADGGSHEEHDLGTETLRHGWRFLPHLREHWGRVNLRVRKDSFPSPRRDACPEPASSRLEHAIQGFAQLFPARAPLKMVAKWGG
jgi:hypothetical protein